MVKNCWYFYYIFDSMKVLRVKKMNLPIKSNQKFLTLILVDYEKPHKFKLYLILCLTFKNDYVF